MGILPEQLFSSLTNLVSLAAGGISVLYLKMVILCKCELSEEIDGFLYDISGTSES